MSSWTRPVAGLAALAIAIAACGGSATPAASTQATSAPGTSQPAASEATASTAPEATAVPTTGGTGGGVAGAASSLANLDSYHLKMALATTGMQDSMFSAFGDGFLVDLTQINLPAKAADVSISMGTAASKMTLGYRLVGDKAWMRIGDSWTPSTAAEVQSSLDSFAPDKLFGGFEGVSGVTPAGDETKNGVHTTHYTVASAAVADAVGSSIGLPNATWTVDFWMAKDGGYPIAYSVVGKGATGSFSMTLDVTDINSSSNKVDAPAG